MQKNLIYVFLTKSPVKYTFVLLILFFLTDKTSFSQLPTPIANYTLDGNGTDVSGNSLNGIEVNITPGTDRCGNPNGACSFNGFSSSINIPFSPFFSIPPDGEYTISAWIRPNSSTVNAIFVKCFFANPWFSGIWDYGLYLINGNAMSGAGATGHVILSNSLIPNQGCWSHIVSAYDNGIWKLYINGVLESQDLTLTRFITQDNFSGEAIGKKGDSDGDYFDGKIDDLQFYNVALTNSEVASLYESQKVLLAPNVSSTSICPGDDVQLEIGTICPISIQSTYSWSPSAGLNTSVGPIVIASPAISTQYFATVTTEGCSITDTFMVSLLPLPQLTINDASICFGDTISLNVSGAVSYSWSPGSTLNTTTGSSVLAFPTSTTVYTITGTDSNSCVGSKNVMVTLESITVNVNSDTICNNDSNPMVTLTASGALSYLWSPPTGLSGTSGNSVVSRAISTTNYTVIGESVSGCSDSAQALVTVVPFFDLQMNSDSICVGESVLLIASGANTYQWSTTEGVNLGSGSEIVVNPIVTTEYMLIGTIPSCEDTAFSSVTVFPIPSASILASPNPVSATNPEVTFSTISPGNTITWLIGGNLISNLASFTHDFQDAVPGNYPVLLVLENQLGCADTISVTIIIEEDVLFFIPNSFTPNSDEFNTLFLPILTSGISSTGYEFKVYNRWGEIVFESNNSTIGWDGTYKGNMSQDGTYVWKLAFNSKYTSKRYEYTGHLNLLK